MYFIIHISKYYFFSTFHNYRICNIKCTIMIIFYSNFNDIRIPVINNFWFISCCFRDLVVVFSLLLGLLQCVAQVKLEVSFRIVACRTLVSAFLFLILVTFLFHFLYGKGICSHLFVCSAQVFEYLTSLDHCASVCIVLVGESDVLSFGYFCCCCQFSGSRVSAYCYRYLVH